MSNFIFKRDEKLGELYVETPLHGKSLLTLPQLNKGTAFTSDERWTFGLQGKLPYRIETIEEQAERAYQQFSRFKTDLEKNIYLTNIHSINETLLYYLIGEHLDEMLPIVYTPTVAESVKSYSLEFRKERGMYITYPDRHRIKELLAQRTNLEVDIIVASDAEGVLGIGDQGIGGMDIPVAKLMVYTLCAGLNPGRCVPVFLDAGTDNEALLNDPMYLGWRHKRVRGEQYDEMISLFVEAVKDIMPHAFLHWEDFGRANARRILERYTHEICSFNDDMQGTAAVTVAALLAATKAAKIPFEEQKIIIFGAGTAGAGIADQICEVMQVYGLSEEEARKRFWFLDRNGLLTDDMGHLAPYQKVYARNQEEVKDWLSLEEGGIDLEEVVRNVEPTTLIGCSTATGAFNKRVVKTMASKVDRPIIFPLSNPTEKAEAHPEDLLNWTKGKALVATGSPFNNVTYDEKPVHISQCNNALVFPGIGLGVVAINAKRLSRRMLWAACQKLSEFSPLLSGQGEGLLPYLHDAKKVSHGVAKAVAEEAIKNGVAELPEGETIESLIEKTLWEPRYYPYKLVQS